MAATAAGYFLSGQRPRIVLFGDSLTERGFDPESGWAAALAHHYARKADVVNRGLSGYNTRWALHTADHVFPPPADGRPQAGQLRDVTAPGDVLFATIFFGANDAARPDGPGHSARQHVPIPEYKDNLRAIAAKARAAGVGRLVVVTPPPVWEKGRKDWQVKRMGEEARPWPLDRTQDVTAEYAQAAKAVAQELGLPCLDLQTQVAKVPDWGDALLCDGLHFTPPGQALLFRLLRELLEATWPEIGPERLPMQFPAWDAVDMDNPKRTFA